MQSMQQPTTQMSCGEIKLPSGQLQEKIDHLIDSQPPLNLDDPAAKSRRLREVFLAVIWPKIKDEYDDMRKEVEAFVKVSLKSKKISADVYSRLKDDNSINKSLERRERKGPFKDLRHLMRTIHDLVGLRVIYIYEDGHAEISTFVDLNFKELRDPKHWDPGRDVGAYWKKPWFGAYKASNLRIGLEEEGDKGKLAPYVGVMFELQIVGFSDDLYNKLFAHDLLYKLPPGSLTKEQEIMVDLAHAMTKSLSLIMHGLRPMLEGDHGPSDGKAASVAPRPSKEAMNEAVKRIVDAGEPNPKGLDAETLMKKLDTLLDSANEMKKDKMLSWLNVTDPLITHSGARAHRLVDSNAGQWFFDNYFDPWRRMDKSFMWITGKAGSGKTVLSSSIIDKLLRQSDCFTIYYYISFQDASTQDLAAIKHSLMMQLVRCHVRDDEDHRVPEVFKHLFEKYSHSQHPLQEDVDSTILGLLNQSKQTFVVVDALDEFSQDSRISRGTRTKVIQFLNRLCQESGRRTCVAVTSRILDSIEKAIADIGPHTAKVLMSTSKVNMDIKNFLDVSLDNDHYKFWKKELKKQVVKKLMSKADGVFRWAALQLQLLSLLNLERAKDVRAAMSTLPDDLTKTYQVMLNRIERSGDVNCKVALSILPWLAYARRPLLLSELSEIAVFESKRLKDTGDIVTDWRDVGSNLVSFHPRDRFPSIWKARTILSGLITVSGIDDIQDNVAEERDGTVSFSHFTVLEYLQKKDMSPRTFHLDSVKGHQYITLCCLSYIRCYDELHHGCRAHNASSSSGQALDSDSMSSWSDSEPSDDYRPFTLLLYAMKNWWYHASSSGLPSTSRASASKVSTRDEIVELVKNKPGETRGPAFEYSIKVALAISDYGVQPLEWNSGQNSTKHSMSKSKSDVVASMARLEIRSDTAEVSEAVGEDFVRVLSESQRCYAFDLESPVVPHHAASLGDGLLIQVMADAGADLNHKSKGASIEAIDPTPLHIAVRNNSLAAVKQLVEANVDQELMDGSGRTPFWYAAVMGFPDIAECLIDHGADIRACEGDLTPTAKRSNFMETLTNNYRRGQGRTDGWTILHWAIQSGQQETAALIVRKGAQIFETDWCCRCPLSMAIIEGQQEVVRAMVERERGRCGGTQFRSGLTTMHLAAAYRDVEMMNILLTGDAIETDSQSILSCRVDFLSDSYTALDMAVVGVQSMVRQYDVVDEMIKGPTRSMGDATQAIRFLAEKGSQLGSGDHVDHSVTPLHHAAFHGQIEAAKALLDLGALADQADTDGCTPLMKAVAPHTTTAVARNSLAMVELLLQRGAVPDHADNLGRTPLIVAASRDRVDIVRALVNAHAEVEARTIDGLTALMVASINVHYDVVEALLDAGADLKAKGPGGKTASMLVRECEVLYGRDVKKRRANRFRIPMDTHFNRKFESFEAGSVREFVGGGEGSKERHHDLVRRWIRRRERERRKMAQRWRRRDLA